jgi:hypothetical protein
MTAHFPIVVEIQEPFSMDVTSRLRFSASVLISSPAKTPKDARVVDYGEAEEKWRLAGEN